jgi:hypothetical membrane protein
MKMRFRIAPVLGILIAATYLSFFTLALFKYPQHFSPLSNWLSDLGNRIVSPDGSRYYNSGIILSAVLLAIFFFAAASIRLETNREQRIVLALSQTFGIVGAVAMILTGVFSIDTPIRHSLASAIFRICIGTSFGLSVAALRYFKNVKKWILVIGGVTTLFDLCVSLLFNRVHLLEWPVILLFLIYCILLGFEIGRLVLSQGSQKAGVA